MARNWRDVGGAYAKALATAQGETDALISELANLWRAPELTAEEAMLRAQGVQAQVSPILEGEKEYLRHLREQLDHAREETKVLAVEVGEPIPVDFGKQSILEQICSLQSDRSRYADLRESQKEELQTLIANIGRVCKRLDVDGRSYTVDPAATGIAGLRTANQHIRALDLLEKERLATVKGLRSKISAMMEKLGDTLEFRLAYDGEMTGCEDGLLVLESSEENRRFVAEIAEFKHAGPSDATAFARCTASLKRVAEEYSQELSKKKQRAAVRSRSRSAHSRSYSYSRSRSRGSRPGRHRRSHGHAGPGHDGRADAAYGTPPPPQNAGWRPPGSYGSAPPDTWGAPPPGGAPPPAYGSYAGSPPPHGALPAHVGYGPPPGVNYGHPPEHRPPPGYEQYSGYHAGYHSGHPPPPHAGYDGRPPPPHAGYEGGHPPPAYGGSVPHGYATAPAHGGAHYSHGYGGAPPAYGGAAPPPHGYVGAPPAHGYGGPPPPGYAGGPPPGEPAPHGSHYGAPADYGSRPPADYAGRGPPAAHGPPPDYGSGQPPPGQAYGAPPPGAHPAVPNGQYYLS